MTAPKLGKDALLDAAAVLFDDLGVDAVSLSQINQASGHRNRSAVNYHFGGKDAVIQALVERSMRGPDTRRSELLDALEREDPSPSTRAVIEVMVAPLSEGLGSVEGRRHLRLLGQLVGHPHYVAATQQLAWATPSLSRCLAHLATNLAGLTRLPEAQRTERVALLGAFIVHAYADQATLLDTDEPLRQRTPLPTAAFTTNLVDLLVAMLDAPVSPVT